MPGNIKIVTEKMMTDMEKFLRTSKAQQMPSFLRFTMALDAAKGERSGKLKKNGSLLCCLEIINNQCRNELASWHT
jgi:hypothetical protein